MIKDQIDLEQRCQSLSAHGVLDEEQIADLKQRNEAWRAFWKSSKWLHAGALEKDIKKLRDLGEIE